MSSGVKMWMPLFIGDYLADTMDLNNSQNGAYLKCIMHYWRKGSALNEDELKSICGKDVQRVKGFFFFNDGFWHHKRIDEELSKANMKRELAIARSKAANAAKMAKQNQGHEI